MITRGSVSVDVEVEVDLSVIEVVMGVLLEVEEAIEELEVEEMVKLRLLEFSPELELDFVPLVVVLVTSVLGTHSPLTPTSPFLVQYPTGHD